VTRAESIAAGERYEVRRLSVAPLVKLSLHAHRHRCEHWVIVKGVARVTRGSYVLELHENESIFIPRQIKHRLENPGPHPLEVIEVRVGSYLGEDDAIRFDDETRRT
jgi:mannose-6-phosphate isomerase-like protein (cupin superfamily)